VVGFFNGSWRNTTGFDPLTNTWYQVVGTYDGSVITQYVNGMASGGTVNYVGTSQSGGEIRLMRRWDGTVTTNNLINGDLSIVRVYNTALNSTQILQNYNENVNRFFPPPSETPTPSITPSETPTPSITPPIPSIIPSETSTPPIPSITPSITLTPTPTQTVPQNDIDTNGLILYVNFSNTSSYSGSGASVFDLSPNGYTGTLNDTYTYNSTTKTMNFGTNSGYIGWGTGAALVRSASVMSIGVLIRPISIPWGNSGFRWSCPLSIDNFNVGPSARKFTMYFYNVSNNTTVAPNLAFDFFDGSGGGAGLTKSSSNWLNQDLYVVATCESGTNNAKLYINGVLEHTINGITPNTNPSNSAPLNTGRIGTGFDGQIGESNLYSIHMYNRILSEAEIVSNYNILKNQFGI
jgi:hypothetical protein